MYLDIMASNPFKIVENQWHSPSKNNVFSCIDYSVLSLVTSQRQHLKSYTLIDRDNTHSAYGIYSGYSETLRNDKISFYSRLVLSNRKLECAIKDTHPSTAHIFENQEIVATLQKNYEIFEHHTISPTFRLYHEGNLLSTIPINFDQNIQKIHIHKADTVLEFQLQSSHGGKCSCSSRIKSILRRLLGQPNQNAKCEKLFLGSSPFEKLTASDLEILLFSILVIKSEFVPHDFPNQMD